MQPVDVSEIAAKKHKSNKKGKAAIDGLQYIGANRFLAWNDITLRRSG